MLKSSQTFATVPSHSTFLPALEACSEDVEAITQCFLTHVGSTALSCVSYVQSHFLDLQKTKFSIYMQYCKNKPTSDSARAEHDVFFRQRQTALGHKLNIEDFLIAPVQRFTKYQLLLRVRLFQSRPSLAHSCMHTCTCTGPPQGYSKGK